MYFIIKSSCIANHLIILNGHIQKVNLKYPVNLPEINTRVILKVPEYELVT